MVKRSPQTFAVGVTTSSGMASLVHLDNLECASSAGSTNEQITKLFPKCRPRDINLNPVVTRHSHHTPSSPFDDLSNDNNTGVQDADTDRCILKQLKENRELAQPETTTTSSAPPADGAETLPFRQVNHHHLHHLTASTATSSSTTTSGDDDRDASDDDDDELLDELDPLAGVTDDTDHVVTTNLMDDPLILGSLSAEACQDMSALAAGYKLRDSRIIEIAGGRELYSASRSKAARGGGGNSAGGSGKPKPGVWELRARCSSAGDGGDSDGSLGGTGSEVTETVFASEVLSLRHGSGTAPALNVATIAGREVVVFDDIGEDWRGGVRLDLNKVRLPVLDDEPLEASPPSPACRRGAIDFFQAVASGSELDGGVGAGGRVGSSLAQHPTSGSNSSTNKGPRLIGGVPIAEYEGSPRRYGRSGNGATTNGNESAPVLPTAQSLLASPSVYPPRPGFPQRVLPADADDEDSCPSPTSGVVIDTNTTTSAFDYLYEFSETRKVLEEFFKNPAPSETCTKEFEELDYELRRQSGPSTNNNSTSNGNAYVGLRLSKISSALNGAGGVSEDEDDESKCPRSGVGSEMIESVERHFLDLSADTGSTDDLGENEVGQSRNFTLSPETTDCDSNCGDLDSEASLMLLDSSDGVGIVGDGTGVLAGLGSASIGGGGSTGSGIPDTLRLYSSMPVLEDGLSSGHASDTENVSNPATVAMLMKRQITEIEKELGNGGPRNLRASGPASGLLRNAPSPENLTLRVPTHPMESSPNSQDNGILNVNSRSRHDSYDTADPELEALDPLGAPQATPPPPAPAPHRSNLDLANNATTVPTSNSTPASTSSTQQISNSNCGNSTSVEAAIKDIRLALQRAKTLPLKSPPSALHDPELADSPIWIPRRRGGGTSSSEDPDHRKSHDEPGEEEEADTDLETDRLLGQQRTDDHGFFDDKTAWRKPKSRTVMPTTTTTNKASSMTSAASGGVGSGSAGASGEGSGGGNSASANSASPSGAGCAGGTGTTPTSTSTTPSAAASPAVAGAISPSAQTVPTTATSTAMVSSPTSPPAANGKPKKDKENNKRKGRNKEVMIHEPAVLIEGVLFRARYLGSTQLVCEGQPTKTTRMLQAEEAVSRIKASMIKLCVEIQRGLAPGDVPVQEAGNHQMQLTGGGSENPLSPAAAGDSEGNGTRASVSAVAAAAAAASGTVFRLRYLGSVEVDEEGGRKRRKRLKKHMVEEAVTKLKAPEGETQPSTEVDLFISTEKIMVLNTDLKEIMMDHALRTISYIADIGDLVVLMARRRFVPHDVDEPAKLSRAPKMICHVFESEEAQFIAQSIGQAFQVAYMEFLKANGIEDHSFVKEMDYQEVLNSQEIFGDELQMFAKKEMQKEVVVPKAKGEILGVVIVESGWGSMLPTVVIANLAPSGAAARCGQLNIGDQIIAINGVSLVGLPLSTCQNYIKNTKNQTVVKLTVVPCAPVVEVKIKRPDTKYQLGFSVQNGVICSLLRGGIAERGGVRVGHRIIEINNQSVVAVPHEKIVNLLATSVGEILMKTMPTSMFRLLTGQETPVFI